jgi:hypothetical protein
MKVVCIKGIADKILENTISLYNLEENNAEDE